MSRPNNVNELMSMAANAAMEGDVDTLFSLQAVTSNWLQDDESRNAQEEMLNAFIEMVENS